MSQESLSIEQAVDLLGADHVAHIINSYHAYWSREYGDSFKGRAHGMWLANLLPEFAAYSRLAVQSDYNTLVGVLLERGHDVEGSSC